MLARAAGHTVYVSRTITVVIVRVPQFTNNIEYYLEGLERIIEDTRPALGHLNGLVLRLREKDSCQLMWMNSDRTWSILAASIVFIHLIVSTMHDVVLLPPRYALSTGSFRFISV